jgi:hypothetical protein
VKLGSLDYDAESDHYVLRAEPHVVLRLKRIFARIGQRSHGVHFMRATREVSRELEWFLVRYPLKVTERAASVLASRAEAHRVEERTIARLVGRGRRRTRRFEMALPPRDYQKVAAELVLETGGLLVADDLGLGKTATAICALTDAHTRPALVVTVTHLPSQWQRELARFAPSLSTAILKKATPYEIGEPDVIITNYHKLSGWAETLATRVKSVVFDECQELRRGRLSDKGAAALHIAQACDYRLGLSATPIYNYGGEIWNVMQALRPDALGTHDEFAREWCTEVGGGREARWTLHDPQAFGAYLRRAGLMLRRTRAEVGRELPPCQRVPHFVACDPAALDAVEDRATELARIILSEDVAARGARLFAAEELSARVRQATGIAKAPYVAEFVKMILESTDESVLLYGWHREVYGLWLDRLADYGPVMFTGSETPRQKEDAAEAFLSKKSRLCIMSLRAGQGLDGLQQICRTVVFGELDWSPGVMEQCTGRVFRDGQLSPVVAYYLLAEKGSDPSIADVLGLKRAQIDGLRGGSFGERAADVDHIRRLAEQYLTHRPVGGARGHGHRTLDAN